MAAGNFFGGEFFGGGFFGANDSAAPSGGKGDNDRRRHVPFKPTGLIDRPRKQPKEGRKEVSDRVDEARQIEADVAEQLAREFREETLRLPQEESAAPVAEMSLAEIENEIGAILRKKIRTENDEITLLLLMAAGTA